MGRACARAKYQTLSPGRDGRSDGARWPRRLGSAKLSHRRNFSQLEPVNRRVLRPKFSLEFRVWKVDISKIDCSKIRICPRDLFYFFKIVNAISGDLERSTVNQRLTNRTQKTFVSDSTLPMPAFWPRIREQEVKCFHRCGRQQIADRIRNFHSQQAHVADRGGLLRGGADPAS